MQSSLVNTTWRDRYPSLRYIAPFALFLLFLSATSRFSFDAYWSVPLWVVLLAVVCYLCWPAEIDIKPTHTIASIAIGIGVFLLWIAPDVLVPGYRQNTLFSNGLVGHLHSSIRPTELQSFWVLAWRAARAVLIVPVVEELFWRAWLMRWLIDNDFQKVPLGAYSPVSFWVTAILFASEHGPYWDVGLITGIIFNLWMIRSKSLSDCILMHAVTNGALSWYVIATAQWQYWQ